MISEHRFKYILEDYISRIYDINIINDYEDEKDLTIYYNCDFRDIVVTILYGNHKYILFEYINNINIKYHFKLSSIILFKIEQNIDKYTDFMGFIDDEYEDKEELFIHDIMSIIIDNLETFGKIYDLR